MRTQSTYKRTNRARGDTSAHVAYTILQYIWYSEYAQFIFSALWRPTHGPNCAVGAKIAQAHSPRARTHTQRTLIWCPPPDIDDRPVRLAVVDVVRCPIMPRTESVMAHTSATIESVNRRRHAQTSIVTLSIPARQRRLRCIRNLAEHNTVCFGCIAVVSPNTTHDI